MIMGVYDSIICKYPLEIEGANDLVYQTKSMDWPQLELYEIREDGTLWHEDYDVEDRSDPNATKGSFESVRGMKTHVNKRWRQMKDYIGEIRFHTFPNKNDTGWLEYSAYFVKGRLNQINVIEYRIL
jgi:hypothetical protein